MEQELDLKQILSIAKKRWLLLVILPLMAALISGGISFYLLKPVYRASTTLIVGKKTSDLEQQASLLEKNVLTAYRQLAETYSEIAKSRTVREQVIAEIGLALTTDELKSKISVSQVKDTEIIEIAATDKDPKLAANLANITAQKFNAAVIDIIKVDSVSIVDKAVAPTSPIKPNKLMNIIFAFLAGFIISILIALFMEYLDDTFNNSKEVEDIMGLPVLGVIQKTRPRSANHTDSMNQEGENHA